MRRQLQDCAGGERQADRGHEGANTARVAAGVSPAKAFGGSPASPGPATDTLAPDAAPTGDKSDRKNDQGRDEHDRLRCWPA